MSHDDVHFRLDKMLHTQPKPCQAVPNLLLKNAQMLPKCLTICRQSQRKVHKLICCVANCHRLANVVQRCAYVLYRAACCSETYALHPTLYELRTLCATNAYYYYYMVCNPPGLNFPNLKSAIYNTVSYLLAESYFVLLTQ